MDGYRCPVCQTLNYPGLMGFPRCHRCHEQLRQCRYCLQQRGGLCQLDPNNRPRLQSEDGRPFCSAFESRLLNTADAGEQRRRARHSAWLALAASLLVLLVAATVTALGRRGVSAPTIEPRESRVRVINGRATASFVVEISRAWDRSQPLVMRLDPSVAAHYVVEGIEPEPGWQNADAPIEFSYDLTTAHRALVTVRFLRRSESTPPETPLSLAIVGSDGQAVSVASTVIHYRP